RDAEDGRLHVRRDDPSGPRASWHPLHPGDVARLPGGQEARDGRRCARVCRQRRVRSDRPVGHHPEALGSAMKKIRVLVVDDSLTVRKRLVEVLEQSPEIEVVGEGQDGKQAIDLCLELRPDVITLDMVLPVMSGLAATEYIMAHCPTPILIV